EVDEDSLETAFHVTKFARVFRPRWVVVENVIDMQKWDRYQEFLKRLLGLGYRIREEIYDSARFGVAQARRRLYIICDLKRDPKGTRSRVRKVRSART